ncbi:hypothetical protein [Thalassobius sp. Cn5-15]|uniref:hypothetical protein n=1 Tax=Thalassobius sp. Cn5-15 TaxID=2917763 RepID=UPI001EF3A20D|nr:hypothetical protein [Thalassobius sp. Cn5-15]MCG7494293.1 hypothetical protein [Thalassobius sp. Cn5-15]
MDKKRYQEDKAEGLAFDDVSADDLAALDDLFALARGVDDQGNDLQTSMDLMDRVMADAMAVQAQAAVVIAPAPGPKTRSLLRDVLAALGGWPALAGLVTASVAGVWIGMNPSDVMLDSASTVLALDSDEYLVDAFPGFASEFDTLLSEG